MQRSPMPLVVLLSSLLLGCNDDLTDIKEFMAKVQANTKTAVQPLAEPKPFIHIAYQPGNNRNPFSEPKPETIRETFAQVQDCLSPDPSRRKEPLEQYALDNLAMRGTLGDSQEIWALVEASDKSLHRVTNNNYVGLFHGKIARVDPDQIEIIELIPDGAGCWKERVMTMQLKEATAAEIK